MSSQLIGTLVNQTKSQAGGIFLWSLAPFAFSPLISSFPFTLLETVKGAGCLLRHPRFQTQLFPLLKNHTPVYLARVCHASKGFGQSSSSGSAIHNIYNLSHRVKSALQWDTVLGEHFIVLASSLPWCPHCNRSFTFCKGLSGTLCKDPTKVPNPRFFPQPFNTEAFMPPKSVPFGQLLHTSKFGCQL